VLQSITPSTSGSVSRIAELSATKSSRFRVTVLLHSAAAAKRTCELCKANHTIIQCSSFKSKFTAQRFDFGKRTKWCINCVRSNRPTIKCTTSYNCTIHNITRPCCISMTRLRHRTSLRYRPIMSIIHLSSRLVPIRESLQRNKSCLQMHGLNCGQRLAVRRKFALYSIKARSFLQFPRI
jgi:hypothetical protein